MLELLSISIVGSAHLFLVDNWLSMGQHTISLMLDCAIVILSGRHRLCHVDFMLLNDIIEFPLILILSHLNLKENIFSLHKKRLSLLLIVADV
jgi:hypothetical protein